MKTKFSYPFNVIPAGPLPPGSQKCNQSHGMPPRYYFATLLIVLTSLLLNCDGQFADIESTSMPKNPETDIQNDQMSGKFPNDEIARVRKAVAPYHNMAKGIEAGYDTEVTGYRTQMGFHYLNMSLVDNQFELEKPEVLLYAPSPSGGLRLVAAEYLRPIADLNNPPPAPEGFDGTTDVWTVDTEFSMWTLHVWIALQNPNGIFAPHNPRLP